MELHLIEQEDSSWRAGADGLAGLGVKDRAQAVDLALWWMRTTGGDRVVFRYADGHSETTDASESEVDSGPADDSSN